MSTVSVHLEIRRRLRKLGRVAASKADHLGSAPATVIVMIGSHGATSDDRQGTACGGARSVGEYFT